MTGDCQARICGAQAETPRATRPHTLPHRLRTRPSGRLFDSGAAASSMARTVCRQRPHTEPAPQAAATFLVELAPSSMACWTVPLVTPRHRQIYMVTS